MDAVVTEIVVGVDGGNSKTDVAVADTRGRVLSLVTGPGSSPDKLGVDGALAVIGDLVTDALDQAGVTGKGPLGLATLLAGLDLPEDAPAFAVALRARFPEPVQVVDNDTVAALLAGTGGAPGVVVICGAGINAAGLSATGQRVGFLSLGQLSGDWGGGLSLGQEVLWHAVRDEDGRGPRTALTAGVREHFGTRSVTEVVLAIHRGEFPAGRLAELVPVLLAADGLGDPTAETIVSRLIREVADMAQVMLDRAGLTETPAPVVLAGGVLTSRHGRLVDEIVREVAVRSPKATVAMLGCRPVAGALIAALQAAATGPTEEAAERVIAAPELRLTD